MKPLIAILLGFAALSFCDRAIGDNFKTDIDSAIAASAKDRKTLVIIVTGPRCAPCLTMKLRVEELDRLGKLKDFHVAYVDFDSEKGRRLYKSRGIPQLDRFQHLDGRWVRHTRVGLLSQDLFLEFASGKKD